MSAVLYGHNIMLLRNSSAWLQKQPSGVMVQMDATLDTKVLFSITVSKKKTTLLF